VAQRTRLTIGFDVGILQHMTVACQTIREAVDLFAGFLEDGEVQARQAFSGGTRPKKSSPRRTHGTSLLRGRIFDPPEQDIRQGNGNTGLRDAMPAASGSQSSLPLRLSNWCFLITVFSIEARGRKMKKTECTACAARPASVVREVTHSRNVDCETWYSKAWNYPVFAMRK